jgi:hypothetical protein
MVKYTITQKSRGRQTYGPREEFTGKNLTRYGGAGLVRRFLDDLRLGELIRVVGVSKRREEDFSASEICLSMLYGLMMGIFRPSHMVELRVDKVFQKLAGIMRFPSPSTISRFLSKITVHKAQHVADMNFNLLNRIRSGFRELETMTLDLDSHVTTVFGRQERAKKGYNPKKRGRSSYHPLMCFIGETRDYLGGIFRPGNRTSAYHARDFLVAMLHKLPVKTVTGLRADSGFFSLDFLHWLLRREIEFYVVVPQQVWLQKMILGIGNWRMFGKRLAAGELKLPIPTIKGVRLVVIREAVPQGEKPKKQLKLLSIQDELYSYQVIATNSDAPGEDVWRFYNQRACCENFIKEGIYGFGLDKSVSRHWAGARLYFELVMLAYNLMNWFKERVLGRKTKKEMAGTIRWKILWIPAKLVRSGRKTRLRLASWWPYRAQFDKALAAIT